METQLFPTSSRFPLGRFTRAFGGGKLMLFRRGVRLFGAGGGAPSGFKGYGGSAANAPAMGMKRSAAMALLAALLTAVALSPSPGATATVPELGARNTFTSDHSGYSVVTLPRDARWKWDIFEQTTLRVTGDGRAAGFLLVREGVKKPQGIYAAAFRVCDEPGCSKGWSGWITRLIVPVGLKWPKKGTTFTLPAGRYRAYVIADGAPVTARLTLKDLQGNVRHSPDVPVDASVGIQPAEEPVKNVFTGGSDYQLQSRGAALFGFVERHDLGTAHLYNDCLYSDTPGVPQEIAFTPLCEAAGAEMGFGWGASLPPLVTSGASGSYSIRANMRPGKYSFGGSSIGAQSVQDAAFLSLWVNYD